MKGFSLVEVMVALSIAGILGATSVATFKGSLDESARSKHEWIAFTLAQKQMELLLSAPKNAAALQGDSSTAAPGSTADETCADADASRRSRVTELGTPSATGAYVLCWKVKAGSPSGDLRNIRVVVTFPLFQGSDHVFLQAIR